MKGISWLPLCFLFACATPEYKGMELTDDIGEAKEKRFWQCYHESDLYLARKSGKVKLNYQVSPEGKVTEAKIGEANFQDPNLKACLIGLIKELKYRPHQSDTPVSFSHPFNFIPYRKL